MMMTDENALMDEFLEKVPKEGLYYISFHESLEHFVDDMESKGLNRRFFGYYFKVLVFLKDKDIHEVIGYDPRDGSLVTHQVYKNGRPLGQSIRYP